MSELECKTCMGGSGDYQCAGCVRQELDIGIRRLTKENEEWEKSYLERNADAARLFEENEALKESSQQSFEWYQQVLKKNKALKAENRTLRQKNDNWLERCEGLNTEVVDHQFQNDCHSGSDVCACSEKNGYPCYRHIDHEYRKLFALNTSMIERAEKAEAERDRLREAIKKAKDSAEWGRRGSAHSGHHCDCTAACQSVTTTLASALNHKEG